MFGVTGIGTVFLFFLVTVGMIICAVVYGPRLRWTGNRAVLGVLARTGIVVGAILCGCLTILLLVNRVTLTVTSVGDISAFLYLLGIDD